jgi:integrase
MLTEVTIKNAKPPGKAIRLWDAKGLYLEVSPVGGKLWRLKYRFSGKEKRLSLGKYPEVSLKEARKRRDDAREVLANGTDPSSHKQAIKAGLATQSRNSFEVVAREWFDKRVGGWSKTHSKTVIDRLEKDVFPWIGKHPISLITTPEVLKVLHRVEERGAVETAHREKGIISQVFCYAIATSRAERDPCGDLKGALKPVKNGHFAATVDPKRLGEMLTAMDGYHGTLVVRSALRLAPLVFVRPGELRRMRWAEVNFEIKEWRYLVTKTEKQHIVPLSRQAISILEELYPLTQGSEWVFTGRKSARPMSDNGVLMALRTLGIPEEEQSGHGFRATARTLLDEVLGYRPELIEHQLAHDVRDPLVHLG